MHMRRMHISMDIIAANLFMVLSPFLGDGGIIAHPPPPVNRFGRIPIVFSLYCGIVRIRGKNRKSLSSPLDARPVACYNDEAGSSWRDGRAVDGAGLENQ